MINKDNINLETYLPLKSIDQVLEYVSNNLTLNQSNKEFNKSILKFVNPKYMNEDLAVKYLDVIRNENSQKYYDSMNNEEDIYIVYELNHDYIHSNSNLLSMELQLLKGLSELDIEDKNDRYKGYLGVIQLYLNDEY